VAPASFFFSTLVSYLATQLPALIALIVAIVLVVANWSKNRRRSAKSIWAFVLALLSLVVWPVVVATSAWLSTSNAVQGSILNGACDFALRALTGLAWLLIILALFPRKTPSTGSPKADFGSE
jgi:hypothetical protein